MDKYSLRKYKNDDKELWNGFVNQSKNSSFLFYRDYMEYHADRFEDFSLLVYDKNRLIAVFPANKKGNTLYSHQGLTYGGLLLQKSIGGQKIKIILDQLLLYCTTLGIEKLIVKAQPIFYHKQPSNEFTFFLRDIGASLYRSDMNLAIDYQLPFTFHKSKLKNYKKNQTLGFEIEEVDDFSGFWNQVLIPRLKAKHKVSPVHTIDEIHLLKKRFPECIKQYVIKLGTNILAGITIFKTDTVVKSQYGAVTAEGENYRALDFLFMTLIYKYKAEGYRFFDMGTVTEGNYGLLKQKEELGCQLYTQDFYEVMISQ